MQRQIPLHPARARHSAAYRAMGDAIAGVRAIDDWYLREAQRLYQEMEVEGGVTTNEVIA